MIGVIQHRDSLSKDKRRRGNAEEITVYDGVVLLIHESDDRLIRREPEPVGTHAGAWRVFDYLTVSCGGIQKELVEMMLVDHPTTAHEHDKPCHEGHDTETPTD